MADAVDFHTEKRILEAIEVTRLSGKIENVVLVLDNSIDRRGIADIPVHDTDRSGRNVKRIPAVARQERIEHCYVRARFRERFRNTAAEEPKTTRDKHALALKDV